MMAVKLVGVYSAQSGLEEVLVPMRPATSGLVLAARAVASKEEDQEV